MAWHDRRGASLQAWGAQATKTARRRVNDGGTPERAQRAKGFDLMNGRGAVGRLAHAIRPEALGQAAAVLRFYRVHRAAIRFFINPTKNHLDPSPVFTFRQVISQVFPIVFHSVKRQESDHVISLMSRGTSRSSKGVF